MFNINQAAVRLDLTPFYIRKCIKAGKLPAQRELIGDTKVERWIIAEEDLQAFAERERHGFGKRDDGRNKYTIYATPAELATIIELLGDNVDDACLPARANPPKASSNGK